MTQLSLCRGQAKKDLFDGIVDLLTQAFVQDLEQSRTKEQAENIVLPSRDESIQPVLNSVPDPLGRGPGSNERSADQPKAPQHRTEPKRSSIDAEHFSEQVVSGSDCKNAELPVKKDRRRSKHSPDKKKARKPAKEPTEKQQLQPICPNHGDAVNSGLPVPSFPQVEEVIEIEESVVDSGRCLTPRKSKRSSSLKKKKKGAKGVYDGNIETVVLDSSDREPQLTNMIAKLQPVNGSNPLPWWRLPSPRVSLPRHPQNEKDVFTGYISAVVKACIRNSWNALSLMKSYENDPSCSRAHGFRVVSGALLLLERARHMGQCRLKWKAEVVEDLMSLPELEWSPVKEHASFDHFTGCELCLGHRKAIHRLSLKGTRYDSCDFWPGSSEVQVLSATPDGTGCISTAIELTGSTTAGHVQYLQATESSHTSEFWVDSECLRKCLVFHELAHATTDIAEHVRSMIEDEVRHGVVHLSSPKRSSGNEDSSIQRRLERHLTNALLGNKVYLQQRTAHLIEMVRLGDIYFAGGDSVILDSGNIRQPKRTYGRTLAAYDAPLELNDEMHLDSIERLVALKQKRSRPYR